MGYYTSYKLKVRPLVEPIDSNLIEIAKLIDLKLDTVIFDDWEQEHIQDYNVIDVGFELKGKGIFYVLEEVSKMFPEYTFSLEGRGDDFPDDWWVQYFKGGNRSKKIYASIIVPQNNVDNDTRVKFNVID